MNRILNFLLRIGFVVVFVVLVTAAIYFLTGGTTSRGLSDWMVYASFLTLAAGTVAGVSKAGYKVNPADADEKVEGVSLSSITQEFFRAGPFGLSVTLAGIVCFLVAILMDGLF